MFLSLTFGIVTWAALKRLDSRCYVRGDHILLVALCGLILLRLLGNGIGWSLQVLAACLISVVGCAITYRLSPFHPLAKFPGPLLWKTSGLFLAHQSWRGYRHLVLDELHSKYGEYVRIGPNHLSIKSASALKILYGPGPNAFEKSYSYNRPGHVAATSLFFKTSPEAHAARKRIWAPAFAGSAVSQFFPPLERRVSQLVKCLLERSTSNDGVVDLVECLAHWSYDFMGELVFGGSTDLELMANGDPENLVPGGKMAMVIVDSIGQIPWLMDIIWHLPASDDIHKLRRVAQNMMRKRVHSKDVMIQDLASYLLISDPKTNQRIPDADLDVEAIVAVQAGSDNTAASIVLLFSHLISNPSTFHSLVAELASAFPEDKTHLDHAKLAELPYLNAVINEALRLGTPFFLPRIVPEGGTIIDGVFIPGGTVAALAAYSLQVSEEHFGQEPLKFRPDRWITERINKNALVSFSAGQYVCIGKAFALQEMRYVVSRLVLALNMEFADGFDVEAFARGVRNMRTNMFALPLLVKPSERK